MVRLADLAEWDRDAMLSRIPPKYESQPWASGPALSKRRVAIVTTAGLHLRGDRPFNVGNSGMDYRVIPGSVEAADIVMSQLSANFDRSGFQQDINVTFPLDRLHELAHERIIESVAAFHYSFNGASAITPLTAYEPKARELAGLLKKDRVDAVLLTPV